VGYGFSEGADLRAENLRRDGLRTHFDVVRRADGLRLAVTVNLPGMHNVLNSLAAIAVALEIGIPHESIQRALGNFQGIDRRLTHVADITLATGGDKVTIVDDYGHHPTEIAAVLAAARATLNRRLIVVFQPHRYSRTQQLLNEFGPALREADEIVLTDIYSASEEPIPGVTVQVLAAAIERGSGRTVHLVPALDAVIPAVLGVVKAGDAVITLGAGSIGSVPARLLDALSQRRAHS